MSPGKEVKRLKRHAGAEHTSNPKPQNVASNKMRQFVREQSLQFVLAKPLFQPIGQDDRQSD
jgi:hypothetical protein